MRTRLWPLLLAAALLTGCAAPPDASAESAPPPESGQEEPVPEPVPKAPPERLLKEVHYGSDGTAVYTTTYFYDAAGNCVLERTEGKNITNIDGERDCNETVNVYDRHGNLVDVSDWDGGREEGFVISHTAYTYDKAGRLLQTHGDWDGSPYSDETYVYDEAGRKISAERFVYQIGDPGWAKETIVYTYDEQDRLIREDLSSEWMDGETVSEWDDPENRFSSTYTEYFYDEDGRMTEARQDGRWSTLYVYDEHGNCVKEQYVDAKGEVIFTIQYEYGPVGADNQFTSQQGGTTLNE